MRAATIAALLAGVGLPSTAPLPTELPTVALGSDWVLYFERALVIFAVLFAAVIVALRGAVEGKLPTTVSREGFEWSEEVPTKSAEAATTLQLQVDNLDAEVELINRKLERLRRPGDGSTIRTS